MSINASLKYFQADDGLALYYQHWIPQEPKSLLVFVHDLEDQVEHHGSFVRHFVNQNYAVALYDQRGHGKSEGKRGDTAKFGSYVRDLSSFIHLSKGAVPPNTPIYLVGQGFGAQIIINLLVPSWHVVSWGGQNPGRIDGFVTISATIEPIKRIPLWKIKLIERLGATYDALVNSSISLRLRKELEENSQLIMAMASRIQLPALLLHGKEDPISSPQGTKQFFMRLPSNGKKLQLYDGCLRNLTGTVDQDRVYHDIESWLNETLTISNTHRPQKENVCDLLPMPF